ncbi:hypothetical protein [Massilia sp. TS11]|uniref:hypothetical protein n=1 Tax=Massilia sp. TS11 TaxID=2908003 RepID=UPI001EDA174A|nr:hypothetical protein [Massilia sp. TS11]MCG2585436.1 hypothetical protein [Massilia sp. TS11]
MRIRWTGGKLPLLAARAVIVLAALGLLVYLVMWGIDLGKRISAATSAAPKPAAASSEQQLAAARAELTRLQAEYEQAQQAASAKLKAAEAAGARLKPLEAELARLNEDLDALAVHLPLEKGKPAIHRLRAVMDGKQLRYRFFVTQGNKKAVPSVELALTTPSGVLKFPGCDLKSAAVARCEGKLDLPDGASVSALEARLLEKGQLRAAQSANVYNE